MREGRKMTLTMLGTGTSTGVPQVGCSCPVCRSTDPRDNRLRTSALLCVDGKHLLIDCGPDFRQQILRIGSPAIDALLVTKSQYDHVGGIYDLRPYCYRPDGSFIPIYCQSYVARDLRERMPYCFCEKLYPGVPRIRLEEILPYTPFSVEGVEVEALPVMHYRLPIVGFKIVSLVYVTDCKTMPEATLERLRAIDTLVINALHHGPHLSHMNLEEALALISKINPRRAFLIHMSHNMGLHRDLKLPDGVEMAYDGQEIEI